MRVRSRSATSASHFVSGKDFLPRRRRDGSFSDPSVYLAGLRVLDRRNEAARSVGSLRVSHDVGQRMDVEGGADKGGRSSPFAGALSVIGVSPSATCP